MASLRTAFIESLNPAKYPFFSAVPVFQPPHLQVPSSDDLKKETIGTGLIDPTSPRMMPCMRHTKGLKNPNFEAITRLLNQNINNFSQLLDQNSNDFKDCENFIHVLQLDQDDDEEFKLSELDTVQSISICVERTKAGNGKKTDSYATGENQKREDEDDFSEVEDIEAEL